MKTWKEVEWDCCPKCGTAPIEIHTDCILLDFAYDGDEARCPDCGEKGGVTVDQDTAWVDWDYDTNPKMKRVQITPYATATVSENCSPEVLEAAKKMAEIAYENIDKLS